VALLLPAAAEPEQGQIFYDKPEANVR